MTRPRSTAALVVIGVIALGTCAATAAPSGPRSLREFDPNRRADLELRIWQAYYAKDHVRRFGLLTTLLREPYRDSYAALDAGVRSG